LRISSVIHWSGQCISGLDVYGKLPLSFVPNEGQTDKAVRYYAQGAGYGFFFTPKLAL
jgi:hypothetical protein